MELFDTTGYPPVDEYDAMRRLLYLVNSRRALKKLDKCDIVRVVTIVLGEASLREIYLTIKKVLNISIKRDDVKKCLNLPQDIDINTVLTVFRADLIEKLLQFKGEVEQHG